MSVGELFLVEAKEMANGRMEVMGVAPVFNDMPAEFITGSDDDAPLTPSPCLKRCGLWSRPATFPVPAFFVMAVRPNSVPNTTSVEPTRPRCLTSFSRALIG